MFSRYGILLEVHTDGGPQFISSAFRNFTRLCDFSHVISSPRFPRANGPAEKRVRVVKRLLKKTKYAGEPFWVALLNYRLSPLEGGKIPDEPLMGRRPRGRLPDFAVQPSAQVKKHAQKPKDYTSLPVLAKGDTVRIRDDFGWTTKATIQDQVDPRSYLLRTENGRSVRGNRQHILKTKETLRLQDMDEEYEANALEVAPPGHPQSAQECPPPSTVHQPHSARASEADHPEAEPPDDNAPSTTVQRSRVMQTETPEQDADQTNDGAAGTSNDTGQRIRKSTRIKRQPTKLSYTTDFKQNV